MKNYTRLIAGSVLAGAAILAMAVPTFAADMLTRSLSQGMSGSDVSTLQSFLARDTTIYPAGLVTGYYGALTTSAVSAFQARNGISVVGRVGPITIAAINAQLGGSPINTGAPTISGVSTNASRNGVNVFFATDQNSKAVVYYSTVPLVTYERENSVDVSGAVAMTDTAFHTNQNIAITGLSSGTVYYYMIYTTSQNGLVSVTVPSNFQTTL